MGNREEEAPAGSVIITPTYMYEELRAVSTKIDKLSSALDPALATMRNEIQDLQTERKEFDVRLRGLDKRIWLATIVAASGGAGILELFNTISG
jgi:hypothetical protein